MWNCHVTSCADSRLRLRFFHKGKRLDVCQHGSFEVIDSSISSQHVQRPTAADRRKARNLFWRKISNVVATTCYNLHVWPPPRAKVAREQLRRERSCGKVELPLHRFSGVWGKQLTYELVWQAQKEINRVDVPKLGRID